MPKIFLIKDRLHQQQLRLQESQNLIQAKNSNQLNIEDNRSNKHRGEDEPLSLVAKKRIIGENPDQLNNRNESGKSIQIYSHRINFFGRRNYNQYVHKIKRSFHFLFKANFYAVFLEVQTKICMNSILNSLYISFSSSERFNAFRHFNFLCFLRNSQYNENYSN